MTTLADARSAAARLVAAQAHLAAAQAAWPTATAAVDAARDRLAEYPTKESRSLLTRAFRRQAAAQELIEEARALVRVSGRALAAEQEAEAAAAREDEMARRRRDAARAAAALARLRPHLDAIRALDADPDLGIKHSHAWAALLQAVGAVVAGNTWPAPPGEGEHR